MNYNYILCHLSLSIFGGPSEHMYNAVHDPRDRIPLSCCPFASPIIFWYSDHDDDDDEDDDIYDDDNGDGDFTFYIL